jgi:hypothetical protein
MPVEFLPDEQVGAYGRFTGELPAAEVERFFYLDDADRNLIASPVGSPSPWLRSAVGHGAGGGAFP